MRIAFLSPFYPYRGGIAQFSDSLYLSLKNDNIVKAFNFKRLYPEFLFPGKTQFVSESDLDRNIESERVLDSINPFSWNTTAKEILEFKPDVVFISYWLPALALSLGAVAKILRIAGVKVIAVMHNVTPHEKKTSDKLWTKRFLNRCDGFVILNKFSEKDLLAMKPNAKFIVLYHPLYDHYGVKIDKDEARKKLELPPDKKILLFFGFIRDYKGLDLLIEAMTKLDDSYLLLIAGEVYGSFEKYQKIIDENNLADKIKLNIQYTPETEIPYYFSASDVCVLPYRSATQSGIAGMAYHFDLPVIVTDTGGLAEMVEDNKTGLVVKEINPKSISEGIMNFFTLNQNDLVQNIKDYRNKFSWEKFVENLVKFAKY